jgi:FAD/FMN-containing dehydrogenases
MTATALDDPVLEELRQILGGDHVLTSRTSRFNRTRVPAPFPVHRWSEYLPDVAVLPTSAEQIAEVVKLANRLRIPIVARRGGPVWPTGPCPSGAGSWST